MNKIETREDFIKRTNHIEKNVKNIKTIVSSANKYQIAAYDFEELDEITIELDNKIHQVRELISELE